MHAAVVEGLHFHYMETTGTIALWYNGRRIARCLDITSGSRQFFKVGGYFIKAEYLYEHHIGQCSDEVYIHKNIDPRDKQFFTRLLACSDMTPTGVQWTMFPWVKLVPRSRDTYLFDVCHKKVDSLCDKYRIADVVPYFNINWFIHKGRPLIVDCGIGR